MKGVNQERNTAEGKTRTVRRITLSIYVSRISHLPCRTRPSSRPRPPPHELPPEAQTPHGAVLKPPPALATTARALSGETARPSASTLSRAPASVRRRWRTLRVREGKVREGRGVVISLHAIVARPLAGAGRHRKKMVLQGASMLLAPDKRGIEPCLGFTQVMMWLNISL